MPLSKADLNNRLKAIEVVLLDVDGVLTDGSINYTDEGSEIKSFNSKDGLGIRLLKNIGVRVGVITGRRSLALIHRCNNLGIDLVFDGVRDKALILEQIASQTGINPSFMAFVGDDLPDLPVMRRVGLSVAVADACHVVRDLATMVTSAKGGCGAVRELCEAILNAKGKWQEAVEQFLS